MKKLKVTEVTRNVFCVQRSDLLSCSYFVKRPDSSVVLIDAGMDVDGRDMTAGLERVGCNPSDVQKILITHWHNDHSSGAAAIQELSNAAVVAHEQCAPRLTREQTAKGLRGKIASVLPMRGYLGSVRGLLELAPPRAVEVGSCVRDGDTIDDDFEVFETPGHVEGHLAFLYKPEGVLFVGDALAVAHDQITFMSRFLTEDLEAAKSSMLRCIDLKPEAFCPGHRAPLVQPKTDQIDRIRKQLDEMKWWPIIGCGE